MFDIQNLKDTIDQKIAAVESAEKITREILRELSRDVLFALHQHENIVFINRVMTAKTTPLNKKALRLFFKEFTGFVYDETADIFVRKNKKIYEETKERVLELLEDPTFNFWSWAETEIEITAKPFDLSSVTTSISRFLKKADKAGYSQADVLQAVLSGGFETDTLLAVLDTMTETA